MEEKNKLWKVRTVKNYPEAHNHIFFGEVLQTLNPYLKMRCRTFHFGKNINGPKDIRSGKLGTRIIPWSRIEIVNEISGEFDFADSRLVFEEGRVFLSDGRLKYTLASSYDNRY